MSSDLKPYRRKEQTSVTAVQLDLDTDGFTYQKWGGEQRCKRGDWLVNNQGETYTVDGETFAATYRKVSDGVYRKQSQVWARQTHEAGSVKTKEGSTDYQAGDFLVFNDREEKDGYAMSSSKFESLYEAAE